MRMLQILSCALAGAISFGLAMPANAETTTTHAVPEWVKRSNENAKLMLDLSAKYGPEGAQQSGVDGVDDQIADFKPNRDERFKKDQLAVKAELESRLAKEKDSLVKQDLEIMIQAANESLRQIELEQKYDIPYYNMNRMVFFG